MKDGYRLPSNYIGHTFSRRQIHNLLSPTTPFTPNTGTWGLQGIVRISKSKNFVFFVTVGSSQSSHLFDESIENGILSWQSQPRMGFNSKTILEFQQHDHIRNDIYLLMRSKKRSAYIYHGRLKFLSMDPIKEYPVHFKWKILE